MDYFIAGCAVVLAFCAWGAMFVTALHEDTPVWLRVACGVGCFLSLGWLFGQMAKNDRDHPCATYETQMHYNPALKTMAPMRVCVERGEWIENPDLLEGK